MAAIIFFISSLGDTDLAIQTIKELTNQTCYVAPLSETAAKRIEDLIPNEQLIIVSPSDIADLAPYISDHNIQMAYVGVPSNNETAAYEIAKQLSIPCVIANEYMFNDPKHAFWTALPELANKQNIEFAVPLGRASEAIHAKAPDAKISIVGHLAIDKALASQSLNVAQSLLIRESLELAADQEYVFISGTTQPTTVDVEFIRALLNALAAGNYPHLALRMGLHPGVAKKDDYLTEILKVCDEYPQLSQQFKIVLTQNYEAELNVLKGVQNAFLLRVNVTGPQMGSVSDKVAQAVPGALLNEAVLLGKPGYFHEKSVTPYLAPDRWSPTLTHFFEAKKTEKMSRQDLGLTETSAKLVAKRLQPLH